MKMQSIIQKTLCYVLISHLHKYICLCNEECDIITPHIKGDHEDTRYKCHVYLNIPVYIQM